MITIIDYGMGNLGSVHNMFRKLKIDAEVTEDKDKILNAEKLILPGVGSFDSAMKAIHAKGFYDILNKKALVEKIPVLGICLGMQLLTKGSEEGKEDGLMWIDAYTHKFNANENKSLKIPHMGWNEVKTSSESPLLNGLQELALEGEAPRFYFVHSYHVQVVNQKNSMLKTFYINEFDSGIQKENIFGVQFHPEKSHKFGMKLLENFARI